MLTADEVKEDLNSICAQTKAHWLCFDDIHTEDSQKDFTLYLKEMQRLGYTKEDLLYGRNIEPSYGGGLEIKHQQEAYYSGYAANGPNKNRLVVLSGFDTDNDKYTVYHECAHLFQFKYNILNINSRNDYTTYLIEVHANTFAAMVLLLKADNILEYKKRHLARFADGIYRINDKRSEQLYYISLPIELQLMKEIRKNGRLNTLRQFQKNGHLDFKKIIFYTKNLVQKYTYSPEEFEKIKNGTPPLKHFMLQTRAKVHRFLGETYWQHEFFKYRKKSKHHTKIEKQRIKAQLEKVKRLPDTTEENQIINELCTLDCCQVEMICQYGIFNALSDIQHKRPLEMSESLRQNKKIIENISYTFQKMREIYEKHEQNKMFQSLFPKLQTLDGRDEIWALKEKARQKEQKEKTLPPSLIGRHIFKGR